MSTNKNINWKVTAASIVGAYVVYRGIKYALSKLNEKPWMSVGKLTSIYVYPLKSGHPIEVQHAQATLLGLKMDNGLADRYEILFQTNNYFQI
jgi:hypothetical protein